MKTGHGGLIRKESMRPVEVTAVLYSQEDGGSATFCGFVIYTLQRPVFF
jgi:hypothetical protein